MVQGVKLRKIIWFPFGNPHLKIGFPKLSQAFRMEEENLAVSKTLTFTGCPVGNPCQKIGFPTMLLGVPETRKLNNFAPCGLVQSGNRIIEGNVQGGLILSILAAYVPGNLKW